MSRDQEPYLIVGLGNPGREYKRNRHNVGFMALDRLAEQFHTSFTRVSMNALVTDTRYRDQRIYLAKPQTFMNKSGTAVRSLAHFYKLPLSRLLVIYDDVDLPLGTLRLRPSGGSAGQKGLKSIIQQLGSQDFPRLRIGISRPPGRMSVSSYVLQDFSAAEVESLNHVLVEAVDAVKLYLEEGIEQAMTEVNRT
ncbi:MAG: aminoacyl-tRNA hydrolase [Anaerolineales bacterium]|nr:aminoacyl-tRNA hydrolase [Anaerolineales bacterium]